MAFLEDTATATMDLYYQNFKADEDFFTLEHFKYLNGVSYNGFLQDYYEKNYQKNLAEQGRGEVEFDGGWLVPVELSLERQDNGELAATFQQKPFSFLYDNQNRSVQLIEPVGSCVVKLARISSLEIWKLRSLPATSYSFWYVLGEKLRLAKVPCGLEKIRVWYIPALSDTDDKSIIPDGLSKRIIEDTLNLMFAARQGVVVDMTNNQNPNKVMETEIGNLFRNLKTKQ